MKQECRFQVQTIFAIFERLNWLRTQAHPRFNDKTHLFKIIAALSQLLDKLVARDLGYKEVDLLEMIRWCVIDYFQNTQHLNYDLNSPINKILDRIKKYGNAHPLSE